MKKEVWDQLSHGEKRQYEYGEENKMYVKVTRIIVISILGVLLLSLAGCPSYNVYRAEMDGRAEMAQAEQNRRIKIEEAKANLEAQKLNAEAEIERAKGMAEAIEIENGKLSETYIHYLWVRNIDKMDGEKIYIPTEANMPILEATGNK